MKRLVLIAALMSSMGAMAQAPAAPPPMAKPGLTLTTPAFEDGGIIPNKYTQAAESGAAVSPKLTWTNVPDGVVSFAIIALISLPASIQTGSVIVIVQWVAQTFFQLVLLSIILVGQNIISAAADARSEKTFEDTEKILDRLDVHTDGGIKTILDAITGLKKAE